MKYCIKLGFPVYLSLNNSQIQPISAYDDKFKKGIMGIEILFNLKKARSIIKIDKLSYKQNYHIIPIPEQ